MPITPTATTVSPTYYCIFLCLLLPICTRAFCKFAIFFLLGLKAHCGLVFYICILCLTKCVSCPPSMMSCTFSGPRLLHCISPHHQCLVLSNTIHISFPAGSMTHLYLPHIVVVSPWLGDVSVVTTWHAPLPLTGIFFIYSCYISVFSWI